MGKYQHTVGVYFNENVEYHWISECAVVVEMVLDYFDNKIAEDC